MFGKVDVGVFNDVKEFMMGMGKRGGGQLDM